MADSKFRDSLRDFLTQYPLWTAFDEFLDSKWGKRFLAFLGGAVVSGIGWIASLFTALGAGWKYGLFGAFVAFLFGALVIYLTKETSIPQPGAALGNPHEAERPITLRFENREPFVVVTPTTHPAFIDGLLQQVEGPHRVYVRLFPECIHPIGNCTGYLLEVCRKVGGVWQRTVFNEAWPLTWANYLIIPVTVRPTIGPYLDLFYIQENDVRIVPCIRHQGAPLRMVNPPSEVFGDTDAEFLFKVQVMANEPLSEPICLKVKIGSQWDRPIVELSQE